MQFNVMPRTGGLAINREKIEEKEGNDGIILTATAGGQQRRSFEERDSTAQEAGG